jgi:hypothetical protein
VSSAGRGSGLAVRPFCVVRLLHVARAADPDLRRRLLRPASTPSVPSAAWGKGCGSGLLCRPSPPQIWICVVPASAPVAAIAGRVAVTLVYCIRAAAAVQLGFRAQDLRQLVQLGLLSAAAPLVCLVSSLLFSLIFIEFNMATNAIVVNITLDGQNYPEWAFCVETALRGHGLLFHLTDAAPVLADDRRNAADIKT